MVMDGLNTSIIGRAIEAGLLEINAVNIRDYSTNKHMKVDDYPYGGGAGLVMQPEPVYRAYKDLEKDMKKKPRVVYLTPQGTTFHQEMAKELAKEEELVFLCGHYERIHFSGEGQGAHTHEIGLDAVFRCELVLGFDHCGFGGTEGNDADRRALHGVYHGCWNVLLGGLVLLLQAVHIIEVDVRFLGILGVGIVTCSTCEV